MYIMFGRHRCLQGEEKYFDGLIWHVFMAKQELFPTVQLCCVDYNLLCNKWSLIPDAKPQSFAAATKPSRWLQLQLGYGLKSFDMGPYNTTVCMWMIQVIHGIDWSAINPVCLTWVFIYQSTVASIMNEFHLKLVVLDSGFTYIYIYIYVYIHIYIYPLLIMG